MKSKSLSAILVLTLSSICFGQFHLTDGVDLIYTPSTGDILAQSSVGPMTTFEMTSAGQRFTSAPNDALKGLFDVNSASKVFKLEPAGFDSLDLPGVLPARLPCGVVAADLTLSGSFAAGGSLEPVNFHCIPETNRQPLFVIFGLSCVGFRRRRKKRDSLQLEAANVFNHS